MKKIITVVFVVIFVLLSGFVFPHFFIDGDNIGDFEEDRGKFAQYALYEVKTTQQNKPQKALVVIYRILEVNKLSQDLQKCGFIINGNSREELRGDYEAVVQTYTIFGMPLATHIIDCQGIT